MTIPNLLIVTDEEKEMLLKRYNITEKEFIQYAYQIKDWLAKSGLPIEDEADYKIRTALLNCKMSLERTKECIEGYFRIRTLYADFFDRLLPKTEDYEICKKLVQTTVMPRLTPDLCRVTILKLCDINGEAADGLLYAIVALMVAEQRLMSRDFFFSNILIIDVEEVGLKTLFKFNPVVNQKLVNILMAVNLRLKNIHFVNAPLIMDRLMVLVKTFLPAKFIKKVCVHRTYEGLHKHIIKDCLPSDYKGTQPSLKELQDEWCSSIEAKEAYFKKLLNVKCKTLSKGIKFSDMFGTGCEGSFKKLSID